MRHAFMYNSNTGDLRLEVEGIEVFCDEIVRESASDAIDLSNQIQRAVEQAYKIGFEIALSEVRLATYDIKDRNK